MALTGIEAEVPSNIAVTIFTLRPEGGNQNITDENLVNSISTSNGEPHSPGTLILILTLFACHLLVRRYHIDANSIGISYNHLFVKGELWRLIAGGLFHTDLGHLLFSTGVLWFSRQCEWELGLGKYALFSLIIYLIAIGYQMATVHLLHVYGVNVAMSTVTIGCSCLSIGWAAVASTYKDAVPPEISPTQGHLVMIMTIFLLLSIAPMIARQASRSSNMGGVWAGLAVSVGFFDFAATTYWTCVLMFWLYICIGFSIILTLRHPVPLLDSINLQAHGISTVKVTNFDPQNQAIYEEFLIAEA